MANPYKKPWPETVSNRSAGCIERVHVRYGKGWSGTYLQRQRTGRLLHGAIKLVYPSKKGKPVGVLHTPDFFVICQDSCGWIECKMEDHLVQLAEQMPHRYQRKVDGTWRCPPGEEYAQALHFFYRLQSSTQIDWVYQRNLRFLEDYLRASCFPVASQMVQALRLLVMKKPGLTLREVLEGLTPGSAEELELLRKASPKQLEVATQRYKLLGGAATEMRTVPARTLRGWREAFREAEAIYGHGFLGLIPRWSTSGNRLPRLSKEAEALLEKYVTQHYETLKQQSASAVYVLLAREAQEQHIPVPSYRTFCQRIKHRPQHEQTLKRQGPRAAAQLEPFYWELDQTIM